MNIRTTKKGNIIPKILIGAPVSDRHGHLLEEWTQHLGKLNYPDFEVCLVDTSDGDDYTKRIKRIKIKGKLITTWQHKWDKKSSPFAVQMLAHAREEIRQYFLKGDYDFMFWLDDDIFVPRNAIQRLCSYDKDCVGFYVHVYGGEEKRPCVFRNGELVLGQGLQYYSFKEIEAYKKFIDRFGSGKLTNAEERLVPFIIKDLKNPYLFNPYAVNLGLLMVKREVMDNVQFRTHINFLMGEDLWWFAEANDKKYNFWCDSSLRCEHKNTTWDGILQQEPEKSPQFFVAVGPKNADKVELIKK